MRIQVLAALAVADFRERARRPAYAVTLIAAVGLGYVAVPSPGSRWVIMNLGDYRGVYNSAYVATVTALAGALWLMLGGFYVVRNAIARDESTGVGQILAATPLTRGGYLTGKFLSNLMVLASMAGVLAVTALALQVARGENLAVNPVALLVPFILLALPVLALTAAAAVLFETVPVLRAGLGNIVWFFVWMIAAIAGQGAGAPFGGFGAGPVTESMRAAMIAQHLHPGAAEFSLGFTARSQPLRTFAWSGLGPASGFVADRLLLILAAACLAVLPAIWFGRFDPARARPRTAPARPDDQTPAPTPAAATPAMAAAAPATGQALPRPAYQPLPQARRLPGRATDRPGVAAWTAGALFIPSLAFMLGVLSRTHRMFQVVYVLLWYAAVNQVAAVDYMGTVRVNGHPAGPSPLLIAGLALALLAIAFTIRATRHARR